MQPRVVTPTAVNQPIPDFISILREIRDTLYPEMSIWHTEVQTAYTEIVNTIKPDIDSKWSDITAIYNAMTIITADASTLHWDEPATANYDTITGLMSFGIPQGIPGFGLYWEGEDTLANIVVKVPVQQGETWQTTDAGTMPDGTTPVVVGDILVAAGTTAADWFNIGQVRGPQGNIGPDGTPGAPGELWYVSAVDPLDNTGIDGDLALNSNTYDIFEKVSGSWLGIGSLQGGKGDKGDPGDESLGNSPIGGIIMYAGLIADIPSNWSICNGLNGTVDMVDKMVLGTITQAEIRATGGSNDASLVAHSHDFTGDQMEPHTHSGSYLLRSYGPYGDGTGTPLSTDGGMPAASAGTPTGIISSVGTPALDANLSAYVKLAYIQRIS